MTVSALLQPACLFVIMNGIVLFRRGALAWISPSSSTKTMMAMRNFSPSATQLRQSWNGDNDNDGWGGGGGGNDRDRGGRGWGGDDNNNNRGRRMRKNRSSLRQEDAWVDNYYNEGDDRRPRRPSRGNDEGWNQRGGGGNRRDFGRRRNSDDRGDWNKNRKWRRDSDRDNRRVGRRDHNNNEQFGRHRGGDRNQPRGKSNRQDDSVSKIDMKGLEAEGFVHLYGLAPVLSALKANRREFSPREQINMADREVMLTDNSYSDNNFNDDDDDDAFEMQSPKSIKPEAQFTPWLFLQDRSGSVTSGRSGDKLAAASQVKQLAEEREIPVAYTDKGSLNALSGNRPHQGFVLRCGALEFKPVSRIPTADPSNPDDATPNLWLVLDEVVDPQNLGALLRSSYFLGSGKMGIVVCSKNSAPPSPVVSAASAGALELLDVYSTSSLPRTLASARDDGFRIIGAASSKPKGIGDDDDSVPLYDLQDLPVNHQQPTLLVLGSEGHGLRTLVAKLCTDFVRIPRGDTGLDAFGDDEAEDDSDNAGTVDSLNVSVTGGILLWHLLYGSSKL